MGFPNIWNLNTRAESNSSCHMYMCVYVCVYVSVCTYVRGRIYTHTHACVCACVYTYVHMCIYVCAHVYICMCIYPTHSVALFLPSSPLVWWCPLPIFRSICNFPFLQVFLGFPDLVVCFVLFYPTLHY